jgi:hypothetical protein
MTPDRIGHWTSILVPGGGACRIRLSLPGLVGNRPLPERLLQVLCLAAAAVMPGPGAPPVFWPPSTGRAAGCGGSRGSGGRADGLTLTPVPLGLSG